MILQVAMGVVFGGLILAFLLKTRAGWYVLIGVPVAVIVGGLVGLLMFNDLADGKPRSDAQMAGYLVMLACLSVGTGWAVPRAISYYRIAAKEREKDATITEGIALRWSVAQVWEELSNGAIAVAFLVSLLVAPFAWAYAPQPFAHWAKIATIVAWAIVALLTAAWLLGRARRYVPRA